MLGKYKIRVRKRKIEYNLEICRNITILTGDSAIGKTELIRAIRDYDELAGQSGVKLDCDKRCVVLEGKNWERDLEYISDSIVFIDEKSKFAASDNFAEAIKFTDNYYVIITRQKLSNLPYSISEIYTLECSGAIGDRVYNNQKRIYAGNLVNNMDRIEQVITEDSNSGYFFFEEASKLYQFTAQNAGGKDNIKKCIAAENKAKTLFIVDGAAFGPEMRDVMQLICQYNNYVLYAPESFEWLLLKSGIMKYNNIDDMITNTYEYADSLRYFSWERYYESLIKEVAKSNEAVKTYSKSRINKYFISKNNIVKILRSTSIIEFLKKIEAE